MRITRLGALSGVILATVIAGVAHARDLTIVAFGGAGQDAERQIYFKPFSEKTGIPVVEESWDGGYGILQAKIKAGDPSWDVVHVEAEQVALGCADGILEKMDWSVIKNKDELLPDSISDCGVGNTYWSTAIAYDGDKLKDGPKNWADFWDVKKFPGKRALRKSATYNLEFALMADGVKPSDVYKVLSTPEGVDRAFKKLDELKPNLVWWDSGAQAIQLLASGEVVFSSVYNGRVAAVNKSENKHFMIVWPQSMYAIDYWVILKGAANKDKAMQFIAFASQAENQAKMPGLLSYGVPNTKASASISQDVLTTLPTYKANMQDALPFNVDFWVDNSESLSNRFNAWLSQ